MSVLFLIAGLILELNKKYNEDWSAMFLGSFFLFVIELLVVSFLLAKNIINV